MNLEKKIIELTPGKRALLFYLDNRFLAEATPLVGYSKEKIEDYLDISEKELLQLTELTKSCYLPKEIPPSLAFAVTSLAMQIKEPFQSYQTKSAALLFGDKEKILSQAKKRGTAPIFKIKVSSLHVKEAVELIKEIQKRYPKISIRIDGNRCWQLEEALFFSSHFCSTDFLYLEEPVESFEELILFSKLSQFPIAVDETLREKSLEEIRKIPTLKTLVIKPTLLGDIRLYIDWAKKNQIETVFSSSLEGNVALWNLANFSSKLSPDSIPGLDTFSLTPQNNSYYQPIWKVDRIHFSYEIGSEDALSNKTSSY